MTPTISEVAQKAQVSVCTVSRILNGKSKGMRKDATKRAQKVLKIAKELGYQPNTNARGLVMKRTFSIGFIGTELDNPVRSEMIEILRKLAFDKGFQLLVSGVEYGADISTTAKHLIGRRVDGIILGNLHTKFYETINELHAMNFPIVEFGQGINKPWDAVNINYGQMTQNLTAHIIDAHGRKEIVFAGSSRNYPRFEGYKNVMRERGLKENIWKTEKYTMEAGEELAIKMISEGSRPGAIICHNDLLALGIMTGLRSIKIKVPDEIAVVGLDNINFARFSNPKLSTAGVDSFELAQTLLGMLYERIEESCDSASRTVDCAIQLYLRESCGCGK